MASSEWRAPGSLFGRRREPLPKEEAWSPLSQTAPRWPALFEFDPDPVVPISIRGQSYQFYSREDRPSKAERNVTGAFADVYKLRGRSGLHALKVFRGGDLAAQAEHLSNVAGELCALPQDSALTASRQVCLSYAVDANLLDHFPCLEGAILMPWIEGVVWADIIHAKEPMTPRLGLALAGELARVLELLERAGMAHCDLSSRNLLIGTLLRDIGVVDFDTLFAPPLPPFRALRYTSPGYSRPDLTRWGPYGDRFAGAVLLTELLCWADEEVRQRAREFSYFDPEQPLYDVTAESFRLACTVLGRLSPALAILLERVWLASQPEDCPPFGAWRSAIAEAHAALAGAAPL